MPLLIAHLIKGGQPVLERRRLYYGSDLECGKVNRTDARTIEHNGTGSVITHILVLALTQHFELRPANVITMRVPSGQVHLPDHMGF